VPEHVGACRAGIAATEMVLYRLTGGDDDLDWGGCVVIWVLTVKGWKFYRGIWA
jgi:hypothetical protein